MGETFKETISRPEIQFWFPVVVSAISIAMFASAILSKQAVLENKIDNLIALMQTHKEDQTQDQVAQAEKDREIISSISLQDKRITIIETMLANKK